MWRCEKISKSWARYLLTVRLNQLAKTCYAREFSMKMRFIHHHKWKRWFLTKRLIDVQRKLNVIGLNSFRSRKIKNKTFCYRVGHAKLYKPKNNKEDKLKKNEVAHRFTFRLSINNHSFKVGINHNIEWMLFSQKKWVLVLGQNIFNHKMSK